MPPAVIAVAASIATVAVKVFVASKLLAAILIVAISVASMVLTQKRKNTASLNQGQELQLKLDPTMPRQIATGRCSTGGSLAWSFTYTDDSSKPNRYLVRIIDLSDLPITNVVAVNNDGKTLTFSGDYHSGLVSCSSDYKTKSGAACLSLQVVRGSAAATAVPWLITASGGLWTSNHKGTNIAYAIVRMDYDADAFPSGEPNLQFVVDGAKCYDDRYDSTVPGGAGSQRLADPSTWAFTRNAAVIAAQTLRGFFSAGVLMYGAQAEARDLAQPMLMAAYNECDESVATVDEGTIARYRAGLMLTASDPTSQALLDLQSAMDGRILDRGGAITILPGANKTPVFNLTDSDVVWVTEKSYQPKAPVNELNNHIVGTFIDENNYYTEKSFPTLRSAQWEADDGGQRFSVQYAFRAVTSRAQVQRITQRMWKASRYQGTVAFALPLWGVEMEQGDWFTMTSTRWGFTNKTFEAVNVDISTELFIIVVAKEVNPNADEWSTSDEKPRTDTIWNPPAYNLGMPTLTATPVYTIDSASLREDVGVNLNVTNLPLGISAKTVEFEVALQSNLDMPSSIGSVPARNTVVQYMGLTPNTAYAVRARTADGQRFGDWTAWKNFSTQAITNTSQNTNNVGGRPANSLFVNLLDMTPWVVGATGGALGKFTENGEAGTNNIVLGNGPGGASEVIWKAVAQNTVGGSGGWNYGSVTAADGFDPRNTYRFLTWVYCQSGADSSIYFGCQSDKGGMVSLADGSLDTNPYFMSAATGALTANKWYLMVGIVHGASYAGDATGLSGIYDPVSGVQVVPGIDWKNSPDQTTLWQRVYQYYATVLGSTVYFARPIVEEMSASSITVQQIFATVGMTAAEKVDYTATKDKLNAIASDSILSAGSEKSDTIVEWTAIYNQWQQLNARYTAMGAPGDITSYKNAADDAVNNLSIYLLSLSPAWNDLTQNTSIDPGTWRNTWGAAYDKIAAFNAAITGRAGAGTFTLLASDANTTASPNSVVKVGGGSTTWNGGAYTVEKYAGDVMVTGRPNTTASYHQFVGLNADNSAGSGYVDIDYASYNAAGTFTVFISGISAGSYGTVTDGQVLYTRRRGTTVECGVVGEASPRYTHMVGVDPTVPLGADFALYEVGAKVDNITFQPLGADGVSPPILTVSANMLAVHFSAAGAITSGNVTVNTARQNTTAEPVFTFTSFDGTLHVSQTSAVYMASTWPTYFTSTGPDNLTILTGWLALAIGDHGGGLTVKAEAGAGGPGNTVAFTAVNDGAAGTPGASGVTVQASRNGASVWAYANGTVLDWSPASGQIKVEAGGVDVTTSATYSSSASSGLTGSVNSTGAYSVTAMTVNSGTLTITVTYGGKNYTVLFTVTKQLGGYEIVSALPGTNLFEGRVVYLTTDDKLYRYTGALWVSTVAAADLTGQITQTQISNGAVSTPQLAAGAVTTNELAANAVNTNNLNAGAVTAAKMSVTQLSAITATIGLLRTATTGARTEIKDNLIQVYDSSNVLRVQMGVWS